MAVSENVAVAVGGEYKAGDDHDNRERTGRMPGDEPQEQAAASHAEAKDGGSLTGILDMQSFRRALKPGRRLFGLDVGTKTIGIALSDVTHMIASGFETLMRVKFKADAEQLMARAEAQGVGGFVIGLPINLDGSQGPRAQATRAFARNFARMTPLPILLWDERYSTQEAERMLISADASRRRRAEVIDKVAATLILQGALDRMQAIRDTEEPSAP